MNRTEVINYLITTKGYKSYLEIGVQFPESNYNKIQIDSKTGVEPFPMTELDGSIIKCTSDEFFAELKEEEKWDIIFIDGLHTREQCLADILNSLKHLSDDGCILVHDCIPNKEEQTSETDNGGEWTGPVWKSIVDIQNKDGLDIQTIDTDWGIGFIRKVEGNKGFKHEMELIWENYTLFKHELLNIKTIEQWKNGL